MTWRHQTIDWAESLFRVRQNTCCMHNQTEHLLLFVRPFDWSVLSTTSGTVGLCVICRVSITTCRWFMLCNTIVQVNGQAVIEIVTIAFLIYDKDDILDSASLCVLMQLNAYPNIHMYYQTIYMNMTRIRLHRLLYSLVMS